MRRLLGAETDAFLAALQTERVTAVRLNDKLPLASLPLVSAASPQRVPWCPDGYVLSDRPRFTLDPCFHAGCYYVQEPSSMFLYEALRQLLPRDAVVLDLCAAPGGKTTLLSQYLSEDGLLVSNEVVRQRVFVLSENVQKWGNGNVVVTHNQPRDFGDALENVFDCVVVDAPCSGEGMFRKDDTAVDEWSMRNVEMCSVRQRDILRHVWPALKPGGLLIYSTCTYNNRENEDNIRLLIDETGAEEVRLRYETEWGMTPGRYGLHFYPHKVQGEGLYMCALRKREQPFSPLRLKEVKEASNNEFVPEMRAWLQHPEKWHIRRNERFADAYPEKYKLLIDYMSRHFICVSTGFGIGEMRGKFMAPQHSLSMLKDFRREAFQEVPLNEEQALSYLRAEALTLGNLPFGTLLVSYNNVPLGFVKNVGNHSNNLYPNEWRIRKL